ncbi:hypothetical protein AB0P12_13040 [Streptomyces subrutilus]|uniref:hypothetical protein n=1 Tax=Streptomyces subrutilus TaxID=36818 RepID=UPI003413F1BE
MNPPADHLLHGLAANPALPAALLDRLVALVVERSTRPGPGDEPSSGWLATELAYRPDLDPGRARALAALGEPLAVLLAYRGRLAPADVDPVRQPYAAVALLDAGFGEPSTARLLAAHPEPGVRWKLASCPGLPADVEDALAADPDAGVTAEFALWAGPRAAARLARHPHAEVRYAAAGNEAAGPAALAAPITGDALPPAASCRVCDGPDVPFTPHPYAAPDVRELRPDASCGGAHASTVHETRQRALLNPSTPAELALAHAGGPATALRRALAGRTDLPAAAYARFAADPDPAVRAAVAANPATGEPLVRALAADAHTEVRRAAARHPRLPLDLLPALASTTRAAPEPMPRLAAATEAELARLAAAPQAPVRRWVARVPTLPRELAQELAADPDASVARAVAPHPGLSQEALHAMAARHGAQVLASVAANPAASGALLEVLAGHEPPVRKALSAVAVHPNATAAALLPCLADGRAGPSAAAHPALPAAVLADLLLGGDPALAEAAAANPSLPAALMAGLWRRRTR